MHLNKKVENISIDRLKPAYIFSEKCGVTSSSPTEPCSKSDNGNFSGNFNSNFNSNFSSNNDSNSSRNVMSNLKRVSFYATFLNKIYPSSTSSTTTAPPSSANAPAKRVNLNYCVGHAHPVGGS